VQLLCEKTEFNKSGATVFLRGEGGTAWKYWLKRYYRVELEYLATVKAVFKYKCLKELKAEMSYCADQNQT
jgi:hypothetical protein